MTPFGNFQKGFPGKGFRGRRCLKGLQGGCLRQLDKLCLQGGVCRPRQAQARRMPYHSRLAAFRCWKLGEAADGVSDACASELELIANTVGRPIVIAFALLCRQRLRLRCECRRFACVRIRRLHRALIRDPHGRRPRPRALAREERHAHGARGARVHARAAARAVGERALAEVGVAQVDVGLAHPRRSGCRGCPWLSPGTLSR